MGEVIEMCPDCKRPLATKAQWENNHNDGNGCQCAECCASCWGGYDCRQAEKALKLKDATPVLPGSIDYAIAQIEKRFAPEIEQLRKELAVALMESERFRLQAQGWKQEAVELAEYLLHWEASGVEPCGAIDAALLVVSPTPTREGGE